MFAILFKLAIYLGIGAVLAYFFTSTTQAFLIVTTAVAIVLWWFVLRFSSGATRFDTFFGDKPL